MSDGLAAFLVALGVAGLAAGAAVAAHGGLPEASPSPSPTPSPSPSQDALSDDVCELMDEMAPMVDDLTERWVFNDILEEVAEEDDPAVLEALHTEGQDKLDTDRTVTEYLAHAAELATDPEAADAFETLVRAHEQLNQPYMQAAVEAESVEAFLAEITQSTFITDGDTLSTEGDEADLIAGQYVFDTCERDILDVSTQASLDAKLDILTLGVGIMAYYSDSGLDAPPPVLTVSEDEYLLNDTPVGARSPGVSLTDQWINGWEDWCIEVTSEYGLKESFIQSPALADVTQGKCASLTP